MKYNELKLKTKEWSLHDLCNEIYPNPEQEDETAKYVEENFAFLNSFKISNEYGSLYNGDRFMFIDGHIEYLYSIFYMLPREEFLFARDARFNFYQAHISQVFNGLNHFLSLLLMEDQNNDVYFFKNIEYAIRKNSGKKNDIKNIYIDYLISFIFNNNYKFLWLIRNSIVHNYTIPLEDIDMAFLLRYSISYSTTIFLFFKYIKDDEFDKSDQQVSLLKKSIKEFNNIDLKFDEYFENEYGGNR